MTEGPRARSAPPAGGEAVPAVPTVRAVARVTPAVRKVRATAPVPAAISSGAHAKMGPSVGRASVGASQPAPPSEARATPAGPAPDARTLTWRQRALLPVVVGIAAAVAAGTGYLAIRQPAADPDLGRWAGTQQSAPPPPDAAPFAVPGSATPDPFGARTATLTGVPTRLTIKAIGVDTSLETLRLDGKGELTTPKNFGKAGWYADGTRPGDIGPAVIAGHVDSKRGPAVFYRLRELQAGDRIDVTRGGRTVRFTVVSTAWYPKTKFPTNEVYGPTPDRQLRLITCGGVFDHTLRSYKDNLVVYAAAG